MFGHLYFPDPLKVPASWQTPRWCETPPLQGGQPSAGSAAAAGCLFDTDTHKKYQAEYILLYNLICCVLYKWGTIMYFCTKTKKIHLIYKVKIKTSQAFISRSQILTDVVYRSGTELAIKLFCPKTPQVMDGEGPKVQHVVSGEGVSLLNHHHFDTHQSELNGCPQTTGTSSYNEALNKRPGQMCEKWASSWWHLCHNNNRLWHFLRTQMKNAPHPICLLTHQGSIIPYS